MSTENSDQSQNNITEDSLARIPDLRLAQAKFVLSTFPNMDGETRQSLETELMNGIKENSMAPFYKSLEKDLKVIIYLLLMHQSWFDSQTKIVEDRQKVAGRDGNKE